MSKVSTNTVRVIAAAVLFGGVALGVAVGVQTKSTIDRHAALTEFRLEAHTQTDRAGKAVVAAFDQLYQNLRTISLLQSVRRIDRYGENLTEDGRQAVQQIFNNLASNVDVSEVYIVPADLDPEAIDPKTNERQAPILMFDTVRFGLDAKADARPKEVDLNAAVQEEIFEYRELAKLMSRIRSTAPTLAATAASDIPIFTSPMVITCDNHDFDKTHKDADRTGSMFSVPFYGEDGTLRGTITAVILNSAVARLIPQGNAALIDTTSGNVFYPEQAGQERASAEFVARGVVDPGLLYSEVVALGTSDPAKGWKLWAATSNSAVQSSPRMTEIDTFRTGGFAFAGIVALGGVGFCAMMVRFLRTSAMAERELQVRLAERAARVDAMLAEQAAMRADAERQKSLAMQSMADRFEDAVGEIVKSVAAAARSMTTTASSLTASADDTARQATTVSSAAEEAATNVAAVAGTTEGLGTSVREIGRQVAHSASLSSVAVVEAESTARVVRELSAAAGQIGSIVELISGIAAQTNLLALNATIEAARAGEAGRGFAIVAAEVKGLAVQTAQATANIGSQIAAIQSTTNLAVTAIAGITANIREIHQSANAITSSVEEQESTAQEIIRSVTQASLGTSRVTSHITGVARSAQGTGISADQVYGTASDLARQAERLRIEMDAFVSKVRAA